MKTLTNRLTLSEKQTSILMYWTLTALALVVVVLGLTGGNPGHPTNAFGLSKP